MCSFRQFILIQTYNFTCTLLRFVKSLRHLLHLAICEEGPVHSNPPIDGTGLSQILVRIMFPPPHGRLHLPYLLQEPHAPLTKNKPWFFKSSTSFLITQLFFNVN